MLGAILRRIPILLSLVVLCGLHSQIVFRTPADRLQDILAAVLLLGGGGFAGACAVSRSAAAGFRALRRRRLRQMAAHLAPEQVAQALSPLRHDPSGDTRKLIAPLLRRLGSQSTELAPASAPQGRGDEPASTQS